MWIVCFILSLTAVAASFVLPSLINFIRRNKKLGAFKFMFAGVLIATFLVFLPVYVNGSDPSVLGVMHAVLLSLFRSMQIFAIEAGYELITDGIAACPDWLTRGYLLWSATVFVIAPIFTFGFVLSLFNNISANIKYAFSYFKEVYVFTELNEKSFVLAKDLKSKNRRALVVFNDVFEDNDETSYELTAKAREMGAICFKKDVLVVNYKRHSSKKSIHFFAIGNDESENMTQALKLIEIYGKRENTHLYVFSSGLDGEVLLTAVDKGKIKVRRINEINSLINRILYEEGDILFKSAVEAEDGVKDISAVVVGMGGHGTEMVKSLAWFGQMNGYRIEINAIDKDPLAKEKFEALVPELMSDKYNGVMVEGEAQYKITVYSGVDVATSSFAKLVYSLNKSTYVFVSLGNDDINIETAINLRMLFERIGIHPVINAVVFNTEQKKALTGIKNYRGQAYDINFIGDIESSYTADVIVNSDLENDALQRHLKWGKEEEFWTYEYNYRSSMASAIHMKARISCGVEGADKSEDQLTQAERDTIEILEHRRWNAYMRSIGYIFSGSKDKKSRNDLGKMHHDLVDFESLSEEDKRKDSSVGTK